MKEVKFLLILVLFFSPKLYAQEQKSTWKLNILLSHYDREKENELNLGDIGYKINPGLEVLYCIPLKTQFHLSTGLSYQYVDLISHIETSDRFELGELSIPLLLTVNNKSGAWSFSTGVYSGQFLHFSWDQNLHSNWVAVNPDERESYSKQNFLWMPISILHIRIQVGSKTEIQLRLPHLFVFDLKKTGWIITAPACITELN